jgi:prepilin-type N-terminal cleavage/methylation domain-containing protein
VTNLSFTPARERGGFTLIEVLIGVIVLGLGLLGLASIFPAVVVQQRQAADAVQGDSTAKSVEALIRASPSFNAPFTGAMDRVRINNAFSVVEPTGRTGWEIGTGDASENGVITLDRTTGALFVEAPEPGRVTLDLQNVVQGVQQIQAQDEIEVTQVSRLYPPPKFRTEAVAALSTKSDGPQFVWDIAVRRDKGTSGSRDPLSSDALQVAIFVRRIDASLRGALDTVYETAGVVAVAEGRGGAPSLNGRGTYSPIRRAQVTVYDPPVGETARNVVTFEDGSVEGMDDDVVLAWLGRVGQKFVGPQGQLWTVLAVREDNNQTLLTLDQAIEDRAQDQGGTTVDILFTLQPPASVRVMTLAAPVRAAYGPNN